MDLASVVGALGCIALLALGVVTGEVSAVFLNAHGLIIVVGGTFVAMLINTPSQYLKDSVMACVNMFRHDAYGDPGELVPILVRLSEQVQQGGLQALRAADTKAAGGFLLAASTTALEYNNPDFVRKVLETEVNNQVDRANEVINIIRTAGVVSPMFGLIGTLLGIIKVLQNISKPELVGPAMAVAITSAFYGIIIANVIAIPVAGKLRMRLWEEIKMKAMVVEGVVGMMQGVVPLVLERRLMAYK